MIPRLLATIALVVGIALATTASVSSQATNPLSMVDAYIKAVNASNVDAAVALYADDAVHETVPALNGGAVGVFIGKAQIRQYYQRAAADHVHLVIQGLPQVVGNKVTFNAKMSSDSYQTLGLPPLDAVAVAVVATSGQAGRFTSNTITLTPQSMLELQTATAVGGVKTPKVFDLADMPASDLPSGAASVVATHYVYPSGYSLKHVHGGPTYIYVISGAFQVIDDQGTRTYRTGMFDFERPGHVHIFRVLEPTQTFSLKILPPGAAGTIPVQ